MFVDAALAAIIGLFVYVAAHQVENPSLDVPLRHEVNDRFMVIALAQAVLCESIVKLSQTALNVSGVRVDDYNQASLQFLGPPTVCLYGLPVSLSDPLLPRASPAGTEIESDLV